MAPVQIYLIGRERRPYVFLSGLGGDGRKQWTGARADDLRKIGVGRFFNEKIAIGQDAVSIIAKPRTFAGDVIENPIKHQVKVILQSADVLPISQRGIHFSIMDYRESVVRRPRIERQKVNCGKRSCQMPGGKLPQSSQRRFPRRANRIAVSDQHGVLLAPKAC